MNDLRHADHFLFTQHSLATFDSCPLKFKKRYLENLKWDSFPDEDIKRRLEKGNHFHMLAYRYFLGLDTGLNETTEEFAELNEWTERLQKSFPLEEANLYLPEYKLRMAPSGLKLEANFDLLIIKPDEIEIWDWKTHEARAPERKTRDVAKYAESLQTVVYMYVLKELSSLAAGRPFPCEKISMHYWQPDPPHILAVVRYGRDMHEKYGQLLADKIHGILQYDYAAFDKSQYINRCKTCEFNWYCNNDRVDFKAMEEETDFMEELDWDAIEERY